MTQSTAPDKALIVSMLEAWINQRPGLEFANYGDMSAYRAESRSITNDGKIARQLLRYVENADGITGADMLEGFRAYSGRLTLKQRESGEWVLDYCTGQYWPTEYRRAACAVLASIIWNYWREAIPVMGHEQDAFFKAHKVNNAGDYLRRKGVREFGRTIGDRFFN